VKEIRRLLHDQINVLTSASGFIELALDEPERSKRFEHMRRAQKELTRAVGIAKDLRLLIEAKATTYGEKAND